MATTLQPFNPATEVYYKMLPDPAVDPFYWDGMVVDLFEQEGFGFQRRLNNAEFIGDLAMGDFGIEPQAVLRRFPHVGTFTTPADQMNCTALLEMLQEDKMWTEVLQPIRSPLEVVEAYLGSKPTKVVKQAQFDLTKTINHSPSDPYYESGLSYKQILLCASRAVEDAAGRLPHYAPDLPDEDREEAGRSLEYLRSVFQDTLYVSPTARSTYLHIMKLRPHKLLAVHKDFRPPAQAN